MEAADPSAVSNLHVARLPALRASLETALATALESVSGTGLEDVLSLLVESVGVLANGAEEAGKFANEARECAAAAARDSAAAAIAMNEARQSATAASSSIHGTLTTQLQDHPKSGSLQELDTSVTVAFRSPGSSACSPVPDRPDNEPLDVSASASIDSASNGFHAQTAGQVAELLDSARRIASELIALLDDPDALNVGEDAGSEQLRHGVTANQQEDFAAATAWFEESYRRRPRVSTLLSVANMRLKLGDGPLAAHLYAAILEQPAATEGEREMADRKLRLAEFQLQQLGADTSVVSVSAGTSRRKPPQSPPISTDAPDWLVSAEGALRAHPANEDSSNNTCASTHDGLDGSAPSATGMMFGSSNATRENFTVRSSDGHAALSSAESSELRQREAGLRHQVETLQKKLVQQEKEVEQLLSSTRRKDESLEAMLHEVTQTMKDEIGRSARMREEHEKDLRAARENVAVLERELRGARHARIGSASAGELANLGDHISEQLIELPKMLSATLSVEDVMLKHGGDPLAAAPHLLLPALKELNSLHKRNEQLSASSEAVMAAQADAVRKLAASSGSGAVGVSAVMGSAVSYFRGKRPPDSTATVHATELTKKDAEIARLRTALAASGMPTAEPVALPTSTQDAVGSTETGTLLQGVSSGAANTCANTGAVATLKPEATPTQNPQPAKTFDAALAPPPANVTPVKAVATSTPAQANIPPRSLSEKSSITVSPALHVAQASDASTPRNAKAVQYVDTLLGRANRDNIAEEDMRQALEQFEAAKQANAAEDYKSACSHFETSFLLNPKVTTLISTANMHLKLRNPTVAAEIYMRLLQNPSVPEREREVAVRKLAMCETMLGASESTDAT